MIKLRVASPEPIRILEPLIGIIVGEAIKQVPVFCRDTDIGKWRKILSSG